MKDQTIIILLSVLCAVLAAAIIILIAAQRSNRRRFGVLAKGIDENGMQLQEAMRELGESRRDLPPCSILPR